jgi:3-methyladenine DNA glycosylase Tag
MPPGMTLPKWVYKDKRPSTDVEYFSNMTRCIFQGGLNWVMIANKWHRQKIMATIENAEEFKRIIKEYGNFQKWLDGLDKSNNYKVVVGRLKSRFKRVGPSTAHIFLWSVGEPIEYDTSVFTRRPKRIA